MAIQVQIKWVPHTFNGWAVIIFDDITQSGTIELCHPDTQPDALNLTIDYANVLRDKYNLPRYTGKDFNYNLAD